MTEARIKYVDGMQFVGEASSGHALIMDSDKESGGNNTGSRPMELLLMGLGGCSGMDIISILKKKKQDIRSFEIKVKGEKAETYPKKFTEIDIEFVVTGHNIAEEAVKKAVDISMDKYCSVKATLEGVAKINFSYLIVKSQ